VNCILDDDDDDDDDDDTWVLMAGTFFISVIFLEGNVMCMQV
jgi:hypothetical protein